jgi:hypothetical protein
MTECSSNQPGKCFCQCEGSKHTCRCSRLTIAALRAACSQIPAGCDRTAYVAALTVEYGTANGSHALEGLPPAAEDSSAGRAADTPRSNTPPRACASLRCLVSGEVIRPSRRHAPLSRGNAGSLTPATERIAPPTGGFRVGTSTAFDWGNKDRERETT